MPRVDARVEIPGYRRGGLVRVDGVDDAVEVVREEEGVGSGLEEAAGAAVHLGFAGLLGEEAEDEVLRVMRGGGEADDAVARADPRVSCTVESDEEGVGERVV